MDKSNSYIDNNSCCNNSNTNNNNDDFHKYDSNVVTYILNENKIRKEKIKKGPLRCSKSFCFQVSSEPKVTFVCYEKHNNNK